MCIIHSGMGYAIHIDIFIIMHPRGTRFKRAFVVCFHCERSSWKVSGELLPGKSFTTPRPSTVTAGETVF